MNASLRIDNTPPFVSIHRAVRYGYNQPVSLWFNYWCPGSDPAIIKEHLPCLLPLVAPSALVPDPTS